MSQSFTAACVQNCAVNNTDQSVTECVSLIKKAHDQGADLICLPEFCAHLHVEEKIFETGAAAESSHAALATFRDLAHSLSTWILVGSITVCYDLRFAALYRLLAQSGANVLTVPAAFTHTTGQAHWHVLLRARAIETGSFVVAPCQYGFHGKGRTYGHSLIIDPWGEILAEGAEDTPDVVLAEIDLQKVTEARSRIPALEHDQPLTHAEHYLLPNDKRKDAIG